MRYPKGCQKTRVENSGTLFSGDKNLYGLVVAYTGAKGGERVALKEQNATGAVSIVITIPGTTGATVNGTYTPDLGRFGVEFKNGCYVEYAGGVGTVSVTGIHS